MAIMQQMKIYGRKRGSEERDKKERIKSKTKERKE